MLNSDEKILNYAISKSSRLSSLCQELAAQTKQKFSNSNMLIDENVAGLLGFLVRSVRAKRILEIGCFTGFSALAMAENLSDGGELVTLDINEETTSFGKEFWDRSEHGKKIRLVLGDALESIKALEGSFDFVFIDADKERYPEYLDSSLKVLSPGGMIALDNVLRGGKVLDPSATGPGAMGIKNVNNMISERTDLYSCLLPIRDGLFLVQRV